MGSIGRADQMTREPLLRALEEKLGHRFEDRALLERALTHKSRGDGQRGFAHNERLEWLGDRVLGLLTAERLFGENSSAEEGELTQRFAAIVSGKNCADASRNLELSEVLTMSRGFSKQDIEENDTILGDAFEAVMAALWLDGGRAATAKLFEIVWNAGTTKSQSHPNPKSALQEWIQKKGLPTPRYTVLSRLGPDHAPQFEVEVRAGDLKAVAQGTSKQSAEQSAAALLLQQGKIHV